MSTEQDRRIRRVIKSYYAGEITAKQCKRKLDAIFHEPTLEEFWYTTPKGERRISTEKLCLILGCSHSMAQRIRSTLNQMSKEEVLELIGKRFGIR